MATINRSIAQSTDDALTYNFISGITEQVTNSTLIGELSGGDEYWIIGRFQNISIPQSATITNATLKFTSATTKTITYKTTPVSGDFNCTGFTIGVIETDNIGTFSNGGSIGGVGSTIDRSTSNSVVAFTEYTTVDISSLIQVVVDRGGWSSGNSLALAIIPTPYDEYSNTGLEIISYDGDPTKVMELEITYDGGEVNQGTFLPFFM